MQKKLLIGFVFFLSQNTFSQTWKCGTDFTDSRDNRNYKTVLINNQCWMQQNLNYGIKINSTSQQSNNQLDEKYCYNNQETNCDVYGGLYQWGEIVRYINGTSNSTSWNPTPTEPIEGICPSGWFIPREEDWCIFSTYFDSTIDCSTTGYTGTFAGGILKETGTSHWLIPNTGATNESKFTGLGSGGSNAFGTFSGLLEQGAFWTSDQKTATTSGNWALSYNNASIYHNWNNKATGLSLRCIRNCSTPVRPQSNCNVEGARTILWRWNLSDGATGYKFNTTDDYNSAVELGSDNYFLETDLSCNTCYERYVWAYNDCSCSEPQILLGNTNSAYQPAPLADNHIVSSSTITWKWIPPAGAYVYLWNSVNDINSAREINAVSDFIFEDGLTPLTTYTRYLWAFDGHCGFSSPLILTETTSDLTFSCGDSIVDSRDYHQYHSILIGNLCWLKENLNIGQQIFGYSIPTDNDTIEKRCYNDSVQNCDEFGGLYQWAEIVQYINNASFNTMWDSVPETDVQGICPSGWRLPWPDDWCSLFELIDTNVSCRVDAWTGLDAGAKMKEVGTDHWISPNYASNSTGFSAIGGGRRLTHGNLFEKKNNVGYIWCLPSKNKLDEQNQSTYQFYNNRTDIGVNPSVDLRISLSVRCTKDCTPPFPPNEGTHTMTTTQVNWIWNSVSGAKGYKWNNTDDYFSATDIESDTSYCQASLTCDSSIHCYIWAYKDCSHSCSTLLTAQTLSCSTCPDSIIDPRDGQVYLTVEIGNQCWMKENLNYGQLLNGEYPQQNNDTVEKFCYNDSVQNCNIYGGLYQWGEIVQYYNGATDTSGWTSPPVGHFQGICPQGWHIPTNDEYLQLKDFQLGQQYDAGYYLKENGFTHWLPPSSADPNSLWIGLGSGNNTYWSIPILPNFANLKAIAHFWTMTEYPDDNHDKSYVPYLWFASDHFEVNCIAEKRWGMSVRCLMD